jgi:hypothetical protein
LFFVQTRYSRAEFRRRRGNTFNHRVALRVRERAFGRPLANGISQINFWGFLLLSHSGFLLKKYPKREYSGPRKPPSNVYRLAKFAHQTVSVRCFGATIWR